MLASLINISLSPKLVLECLLYIDKDSIASSVKQRQIDNQSNFESVINSTETQSHTAIIRLLSNTHRIRISKLQTTLIINTFKEDIIDIFRVLDLTKLKQTSERPQQQKNNNKKKSNANTFIKTLEKNGYKIRVEAAYSLFMKIIDSYLITDYILIRVPKDQLEPPANVNEPQILTEQDDDQERQIPQESQVMDHGQEPEEDIKPIKQYEYKRQKLLKSLQIYVLEVPTRR
ncbi:hypothetical protein WICPIJ_001140 [Wickerhamomyces pijperi]|uniref:Uncharacterized protein n=1 Tax=Wickerhamomyces pijperi TaxID=599730 RepID=A0A9P8QC42_WICPI|nr:hypothetical protein WICPIJ_001140 [Wickerhamomyces pijperi]